ncbi:13921_t:CDS:2 [Funneliformis geosporum]|uniref:18457_t:CDS:1 n=1 Tax=Funneliformis geosporum TaxID=1117311 RepID=A0A9W4SGY2_9GLOM|nr:13921_t:CDS:2 [Funneliformis geosporum]CAI2169272.1 18457_t:CDS:2 [Funneliformis geosporum]
MPARRKAAESATTPRKTKDSAGDNVGSSPKYIAYVKERSTVTSIQTPDVNPFSREEAIYWKLSFPRQDVPDIRMTPPPTGNREIIRGGVDTNQGNNPGFVSQSHNSAWSQAINNKLLKYLIFFTMLLPILLILSKSKALDENQSFLEYFPEHLRSAKLLFSQVDTETYKIQPIGENDKKNNDRDHNLDVNNSVIFTLEDLRKIIVEEVKNHVKSEYDKALPSTPIEPSTEHLRNLISHEVKQVTNEVKNEVKSIVTSEVKREIAIRTGSRSRGLKGAEMMEIIRQEAKKVVLEELLVFSQDKINKPDFALHSSGANVISKFTSKTYELWPDKWYKKAFAYLSGQGIIRGKPPVTAISPDTHVGQCWPFSGSEGQLAILLNRRVYVTAVTYDHVSRNVSIDVNSAPKEFEVWGIIDDGTASKESETEENEDLDIEPFEENYMESIEEECGIRQEGEYEPDKDYHLPMNGNSNDGLGELDLNITRELHLGKSPLHLFLGTYVYNISSVPVQTFEVPQDILESNKPVRAVIMKVNSNWGKPGYTCLYRFRVHGNPK